MLPHTTSSPSSTVRKKELKEHDIVIKQVSQMNYTILKEDSNEERFHRVM